MKLVVIAVGRLKEPYYREACAAYKTRMTAMQPVEIIEIDEEYIADEREPASVERALEREGLRILGHLRADDLVVALTPEGKAMDSVAFARAIDPAAHPEHKRCVFVVGSSHGLGPAVYAACRWKLGFSPMTFPHQLARLILLEQLYRAQMILRGSAYHK